MDINNNSFCPTTKELNILENLWAEELDTVIYVLEKYIASRENSIKFLAAALLLGWKALANIITNSIISQGLWTKEEIKALLLDISRDIQTNRPDLAYEAQKIKEKNGHREETLCVNHRRWGNYRRPVCNRH